MSAKILIIEDERDLAEVIKAGLNSAGYRCMTVDDPARGFEVVRGRQPDLVITDVMMPKMSGFELCRKIRMDPKVFATPVLMLSAMGEAPEIQHAFEQGTSDYLVKPFNMGVLFQRVKDLLAKKQQLDARNPLTGMPGRDHLQQIVMNKLFRDEKIAVLHFSLAHSTQFASVYGHERRDEAIRSVANMIPDTANGMDALEVYPAHLGQFDFLICCNARDARPLGEALARQFDLLRPALYEKSEASRGKAVAKGREMHPVIGIITNEEHAFSASRMLKVAMELNKRGQHNGSTKILTAADALIV